MTWKIIHITTNHPRDDSRIRAKMVQSLHQRRPGSVQLFVQDGLGLEIDPAGFKIVDTGPRLHRLSRALRGGWRMFRAVLRAQPTIVHFHDPEFLPWAILLSMAGVRVVYDVHEDYPEAISKNYSLSPMVRRVLPQVVRVFEWVGARTFSGIVAVTPKIATRFPPKKTVQVRNWPVVGEFAAPSARPMVDRPLEVAYIGSITENRNIFGMLDAMSAAHETGAVLRLAGCFSPSEDLAKARAHPAWNRVKFDGWVSRQGVADILSSVRGGLVVLKPVEHEMLTYPIKLFEYMAAGVPVISSDFPLWRAFVEDAQCGLLVDPLKPDEIANAIRWILENPEEAHAMGLRGRAAVLKKYDWDREVEELLRLYQRISEEA